MGLLIPRCLAMKETQVWPQDREDPLEKEMATHFYILALENPWTEKPGGLYSRESRKSRRILSNWTTTTKTRRHIINKLPKVEDKEFWRKPKEKQLTTWRKTPRRQQVDFSKEILHALTDWGDIQTVEIKIIKDTVPGKAFLQKWGKDKDFPKQRKSEWILHFLTCLKSNPKRDSSRRKQKHVSSFTRVFLMPPFQLRSHSCPIHALTLKVGTLWGWQFNLYCDSARSRLKFWIYF